MTESATPSRSDHLLRPLLAIAVVGLAGALVAAAGWYRSAHRPVRLEALQPSDRQALFAEMKSALPGVFEPTWFEPRIGYTLKRGARVEVWNDSFEPNELGYRTGRLAKEPGTFRILFLGDSWTYGMGVRESESYPKQLEALALAAGAGGRRVECWTLALPGYNLLNEIAAFELWESSLAADAVVLAPSSNDNESTPSVLPSGELYAGSASPPDAFGEPHSIHQSFPWLFDGHRALRRWRISFDRVRALELHLRRRNTPFFLYFVARWRPEIAHKFVAESGIEAPYAVVPEKLTLGEWLTDLPNPHGNPRANSIYARILYRAMQKTMQWPPLTGGDEIADAVPVFDRAPAEAEWREPAHAWLRAGTRKFVPAAFEAGPGSEPAWAGPGDPGTGEIGLATTLLVHPPEGTKSLEIRVARVESLSAIYPLVLEATISSPRGDIRVRTTIPADGPREHSFRIAVPEDRDGDQALEVVFVADRIGTDAKSPVARSLAILSIRPAS